MRMAACRAAEWAGWICKKDGRAIARSVRRWACSAAMEGRADTRSR